MRGRLYCVLGFVDFLQVGTQERHRRWFK